MLEMLNINGHNIKGISRTLIYLVKYVSESSLRVDVGYLFETVFNATCKNM